MSRFNLLACFLGSALLLVVVAPAAADDFSYRMGRQLGARTVQSAWRNVRREAGCSALDDLGEAVQRSAHRIVRASRNYDGRDRIDYARGYVRGLWDSLEDVALDCPRRCRSLESLADTVDDIVRDELSQSSGPIPRSAWRQPDMPEYCSGR